MTALLWLELLVFWVAWWYPFLFRAPHRQKRESIIARGPTLVGLALEMAAISLAFTFYFPPAIPRSPLRIALSIVFGLAAAVLAWTSVAHLGRQFRITAGLYHDHELVTTGPYAFVRHPIYTSLLAILLCTMALLTPLRWAIPALALFIAGTEIRVHTEDGLLASRFGENFDRYRSSVSAYIPFVR
jgi:protein-S-isoprenylcysteine O-methyltransferase Ste14